MPSPTSVTRPTVRASSDGSKPSRFLVSAAAMSAAERVSSAMAQSFGVLHRRLFSWSRRVRTVPSMTVSPTVATRPPSTDGSTTTLRLTFLPVALASAALQAVLLVGGERDGRADLGDLEVLGAGRPLDHAVDDRRQVAGRAGPDDHRDQLHGGRRGLAAEQVLDDRLAPGRRDHLVGERGAQLVARLVRAGEAEQLVLDLVERALGPGDLEQRRWRSRRSVDRCSCGTRSVAPTPLR